MAFISFLVFVMLYYKILSAGAKHKTNIVFVSLPVILYWVLFIGGQYYVGSDYPTYISMFNTDSADYFEYRNEYVFAWLITNCHKIGIYGQGIFFVLAFIWILLLLPIFYFLVNRELRYMSIIFLVFITFSTAFNNQLNGVRQYLGIYFFTMSVCFFLQKKWQAAIIFVPLAVFSHKSTIIAIPLFLAVYAIVELLNLTKPKYLFLLLVTSVFLSLFLNTSSFISDSMGALEEADMFHEYTVQYGKRETSGNMMELVTKYVYIPLFLWAIYRLPKMKLKKSQVNLFVIGVISFSIKLSVVVLPYVGRIGAFFEVLMCIPITFLMIDFLQKRQRSWYNLTLLYLFLPYFFKVSYFAVREYDYHSIYFL